MPARVPVLVHVARAPGVAEVASGLTRTSPTAGRERKGRVRSSLKGCPSLILAHIFKIFVVFKSIRSRA